MSRNPKPEYGDCYRQAASAIQDGDHPLGRDAVLVHGYPTATGGPADGVKHGHAWIEDGNWCYDPDSAITLRRDIYYWCGHIREEECCFFGRVATLTWMLATKNYGPWGPVPEDAVFEYPKTRSAR